MNEKENQTELYQRACQLMPGGVSSPVRAYKAVGGSPPYLTSGSGSRVKDLEGNHYIDLVSAYGPLILGHGHPRVVKAVQDAASRALGFGAPHTDEVALAEKVIESHPGMEWMRFVTSGTEAVMSALRLARGFTGRDKVLKFEGCYHGHHDSLLVKAGSGLATFGTPTSGGVPKGMAELTAVLPLDDDGALEEFFAAHGSELAAAIIEPVPANNGLLLQRPEYLKLLQKLCNENGALFMLDEVISGFRLGWGGATELYGLKPDLVTLAKVVGGGLPVGAYGGRRELMELMAPLGSVYQAGTLSGNPLALAAGKTTLQVLANHTDAYGHLETAGATLADHLREGLEVAGKTGSVIQLGSLVWLYFNETTPRAAHLIDGDMSTFGRFHKGALQRGVMLPPSGYEVWFPSLAHTSEVITELGHKLAATLKEA